MNLSLLDNDSSSEWSEVLSQGATILRGFANRYAHALLDEIAQIERAAPFRKLTTPGGYQMSVAMTCCGDLGWVSDQYGYRYSEYDPVSGHLWPLMPGIFKNMAIEAAAKAGYADFLPDSCLINRYLPGNKLSLHQDKDELDYSAPIVSVSLGIPAVFLFGGSRRNDPVQRTLLTHGDVVVWGGQARLHYHGVATVKNNEHALLGNQRLNLTFRKAR